ncbi:MAG: DUF2760 domain-containing protein [Bryobacteraceae bacterium]
MGRLVLAFRSFFALLFSGALPDDILTTLSLSRRGAAKPSAASAVEPLPAAPAASPADGALQILGILQRDSRLIDFFMEDIVPYTDDQVGAAVRSLHDQCRDALARYVKLEPVIDGVEGTFTKLASVDPAMVKLVGNVPPQPPAGGLLRHKGWRCSKIDLPKLSGKHNSQIIAPAEVEIE